MDDHFVSTDTIQEAISIFHDLRLVLSRGGFNLTKWISKSPEILNEIPPSHRALSPDEIHHAPIPQKVLGVDWKLCTDDLEFSPIKLVSHFQAEPTQRSLLRATSSVFDPLGIAAPVTIRFRIIQQTIWRKGLKWDDEITPDVLPEYFETIAELQELSAVGIPRRLFPDKYHAIALHVFTDASYSALADVAYFVYRQSPTSPREVCFALGKARVAPLQQHTITKLELQAALLGSRLAKFIQREHRLTINAIHLWTDSTTALQWIYGSHQRQQVFVANRVAEILENTQAHQWNHCPGEWNPADDGTRGIPFRDFHYSSRWFQGPAFLKKPASDWPLNPAHPQGCAKVSASFSSAGPTTQVNSYPGIEFAQEETTAAEVATEEEDTTAAEVATEEEDTTAAVVATEEEETTAAEVATEEE